MPIDERAPGRIDLALSHKLMKVIDAQTHQCYRNSIMALLVCERQLPPETVYAEGWVIGPLGLAIEHGWLEDQQGQVFDPTLVLHTEDAILRDYCYVAALRYQREEVADRAIRLNERLPLITAHGYGSLMTAWWQKAHELAMRISLGDAVYEMLEAQRRALAEDQDDEQGA